jgi:alpha-beta hydrolase superfamily lysophospholipase
MFHGLNSYIGHGAHLAEYFSKNGLITVGFDHRGFGRS